MRRVCIAMVIGATAASAECSCARIVGLTDYTPSDAGSSDGATDGLTPVESSGEVSDAGFMGPNLLTNGDFELGCAGWVSFFGSVSESDASRSGAHSCMICMGSNFESGFDQTVNVAVSAGEEYYGEAWFRAIGDGGVTTPNLRLFEEDADGGGRVDGVVSNGPPAGTGWTKLTAIDTPGADGAVLGFDFRVDGPEGGCLLIDDAALNRLH